MLVQLCGLSCFVCVVVPFEHCLLAFLESIWGLECLSLVLEIINFSTMTDSHNYNGLAGRVQIVNYAIIPNP